MLRNLKKIVWLVSVLFIFASCQEEVKVNQVPLKDFFRNPEKTYFKISPNGEHVSYVQPYQNRLNIYIQNIKDNSVTRITSDMENNISRYWWVGDDRILYLKDNNGDEFYRLYSVNIDGTNTQDLTPFDKVRIRMIDKLQNSDSNEIIISLNKRDEKVFDAYRLNVKTGELKLIAQNPGNIHSWMTDHEGKLRLAFATDGVNEVILYRENEDKPYRKVKSISFKETIIPILFSFDNNYIYASSNVNRDKSAIVKLDPTTFEEMEVIYEHPDVDVYELGFSLKNKNLSWVSYTEWKTELHFLDNTVKQTYTSLTEMLPGVELAVVDVDEAENKLIIKTYGDKTPGAFYLFDKEKNDLSKLSEVAPWIDPADMADMKPISFTSRDGLTIHGYLTLPKGKVQKNLPVVVNPHGGPWLRNRWGYSPETQFLANRGYAVMQINYRGSTGYGREFWEASFKQWGRSMQNDVTDGVKWLISEGIANPKQIGIYGFSYGGYCSLVGITTTPDLYACGVSYSGLSNLFTYMKDIPPYNQPFLKMYYEMVGNPETDAEYFREVSPVFHTDKIKVPVLIAQGAKDPRVNINETNQFVKELQKRDIDVTYIVHPNEGHFFMKEENKLAFYAALEAFFEKNLKNKK